MLLFKKPFWAGLLDGSITLTFRRWEKPKVKPGGRYRCHPIGVLEVEAIERVTVGDISDEEIGRAGFPDRAAFLEYLSAAAAGSFTAKTPIWRVQLHHGGDGDRVPLALEATLTPADLRAIKGQLAALDERSDVGAWTKKALALIAEHPRVAASQLAKKMKPRAWETAPFKANVVKLKKLGLTQSFEVGYELSPRGRAFLAAGKPRRARSDGK